MDISLKIKNRRHELGLSAKEVVNRLGIAESTYRDWENGRKIQGEPYLELSKILDLPLAQLFGVESSQALVELMRDINTVSELVKNIRSRALSLM
jgi:transcriptional regulator with XRE-family HTH domain